MRVIELSGDDLEWNDKSEASYRLKLDGLWDHTIQVDPKPCYAHPRALVEQCVAECVRRFPLRGALDARLYILTREPIARFNGQECTQTLYGDEGVEYEGPCGCGCGKSVTIQKNGHAIALAGKRIPLMPAMTRYLVAHEYGHAAFYNTRRLMRWGQEDGRGLEQAYMNLRVGGTWDSSDERRGWHAKASEVIANDFRTIVMGVEPEFWPHDVPRIDVEDDWTLWDQRPVVKWWADALRLAMCP